MTIRIENAKMSIIIKTFLSDFLRFQKKFLWLPGVFDCFFGIVGNIRDHAISWGFCNI